MIGILTKIGCIPGATRSQPVGETRMGSCRPPVSGERFYIDIGDCSVTFMTTPVISTYTQYTDKQEIPPNRFPKEITIPPLKNGDMIFSTLNSVYHLAFNPESPAWKNMKETSPSSADTVESSTSTQSDQPQLPTAPTVEPKPRPSRRSKRGV